MKNACPGAHHWVRSHLTFIRNYRDLSRKHFQRTAWNRFKFLRQSKSFMSPAFLNVHPWRQLRSIRHQNCRDSKSRHCIGLNWRQFIFRDPLRWFASHAFQNAFSLHPLLFAKRIGDNWDSYISSSNSRKVFFVVPISDINYISSAFKTARTSQWSIDQMRDFMHFLGSDQG